MLHNDQDFAWKKPYDNVPTLREARKLTTKGPWETKSGGELNVLLSFPINLIYAFLQYDKRELKNMPEGWDIRGFRKYSVRALPKGRVGGGEFHRIRREIIIGLEGEVNFELEDINGNVRNHIIDITSGTYIPPFILHSYEVLKENSGLLITCNTLFDPDNPRTHDTYSRETFRKLQDQFK